MTFCISLLENPAELNESQQCYIWYTASKFKVAFSLHVSNIRV